jgi:N-acetylneuraminic acid mutarotase
LYIAGGTKRPGDTAAMHTFWRLELAEPKDKMRWEVLKPWPGPERCHAVAATLDRSFFLISGFRWESGPKGDAVRIIPFLNDAYRYTPDEKGEGVWQRISDLPRAVAAAPSPAMTLEGQKIAVIGGFDDTIGNLEAQSHPGFRLDVFVYDVVANQWTLREKMPAGASRVAVPSAKWHDQYIIASGERAPSIRSPNVYAVRPASGSKPSVPP